MIDTDDLDNMSRRDFSLRQEVVELLEAYNESLAEVKRLREIYDILLEEVRPLRELNYHLVGKVEILRHLEGFDEIMELIG